MNTNLIIEAKKLREEGFSYGQIAQKMLITKSKANYLCSLNPDEVAYKKYQKRLYEEKVCDLVKRCNSINEVCRILGHKGTNEYYRLIQKIIDKYSIDTSHFGTLKDSGGKKEKKLLDEWLQDGSEIASSKLKIRLINEGLKKCKCERCGRTEWEGEVIPLELHHINGKRDDNRIENLQILCCNCHALTNNHSGKKLKKEKRHCEICGEEVSKNAKYCRSCYNKYIRKTENKPTKRVEKEELINSFMEIGSFSGVGKKYGVSGKTIEHWCAKYDLPVRSLDMRAYLRTMNPNVKWKFNDGNRESLLKYAQIKFIKMCLMDENGNVEKVYNSRSEIESDGFCVGNVQRVCRGKLIRHHGRIFKYYKDVIKE